MLAAYRSVLALHVILGAIALVSFWIALAGRKGSPLHLRTGRTYVLSIGDGIRIRGPCAAGRCCVPTPAPAPRPRAPR
jgi:hypothetical protein